MTQDAAFLLAAYDAQLRGVAEMGSALSWDRSGPLFRALHPTRGFVSYESLDGLDRAGLEALVAETVELYAARPEIASFEWKTRGHDDAPDLDAVLRAAGLVPDEVETVMVGQARALAALSAGVELPPGVVVRRLDVLEPVEAASAMAAASAMQGEVFGGRGPDLAAAVRRGGGLVEAWSAEADGVPVSAGRLDVVAGTVFAGIWGGATLPAWRGRGIYRAMTAGRARSAVERGVELIHSDCTAMSRPILERAGLVAITTTTPYLWTRP